MALNDTAIGNAVPQKPSYPAAEVRADTKLGYCIKAARKKKATDLVVLDISSFSAIADYFVICSGNSSRQVQAIAESIALDLKKHGLQPLGIEGFTHGTWILLDYGEVVMHVFYKPVRDFYGLERLWADAPHLSPDDFSFSSGDDT